MKTICLIAVCAQLLLSKISISQTQVILRPGSETGKDAMARTDHPDVNYSSTIDFIANAFTAQGDFFVQRSFLQFDLSNIPVGSKIISAKLSLWCNTISGHAQFQYGDNICHLKRIIQPWQENVVTWNNQPPTTDLHAVLLPVSVSQTQDYLNTDVKEIVQDMVDNPSSSFGFMLKLDNESVYRTMVFASSDHPNPEMRPKLEIYYTDCGQPQGDFTFKTNGYNVNFFSTGTDYDSVYWDFGDGGTSSQNNPNHVFGHRGNFHVCMELFNRTCGTNYSKCQEISICNENVVANFDTRPENSNPLMLQFINQTINAEKYVWNFGDESPLDTTQNPTHTFPSLGEYNVCLAVEGACGYDTICKPINFCVDVNTSFSYQVINPTTFQFIDESNMATEWYWAFGDESSSNEQNPLHVFNGTGPFWVCLYSGNICSQNEFCDSISPELPKTKVNPVIIPNSASGSMSVHFNEPVDVSYTIYDSKGNSVSNSARVHSIQEVEFPKLEPGLYIVHLDSSLGNFIVKFVSSF